MINISVTKRFPAFELSTAFSTGTGVTALFGRSGCGKTTLVNLIAGLERPDAGSIEINGETFFNSERGINLPPEKRRLGYVFQEARLFPHMSVVRNLKYGMRRSGDSRHRLYQVVEMLDIGHLLDRRPGHLSGGEKQRVAIGRALLADPRILLMDEPLASLDNARKADILPFIERLRDEMDIPIIYVSHAMPEVMRLADTVVLMDHGRSIAIGSVEELTSRLDLQPLTGRYEAGAVISAEIQDHELDSGLTRLGFAGGSLLVPQLEGEPGDMLKIRIRARDVILSRDRPAEISTLNILEGVVREIGENDGPHVEVLLDVGAPVWARITRLSQNRLNVRPGERFHVLIKSVAIDRHSMGRNRRS